MIRRQFRNVPDDSVVTLYPNTFNDIHPKPVRATYSNGFFYCHDSRTREPDYTIDNVEEFFIGYRINQSR